MAETQLPQQHSNVLTFPDRHGDRPLRRELGMDAAGILALWLIDQAGETIPENVATPWGVYGRG